MSGSISRREAIKAVTAHTTPECATAEAPLAELFGVNVFDKAAMKDRLPKSVFTKVSATIDEGVALDPTIADVVALEVFADHLADGVGSPRDEHLVPGRGTQPCGEVLETLAGNGFAGHVVVEVATRRATQAQRELDLAEALAYARLHLATAR